MVARPRSDTWGRGRYLIKLFMDYVFHQRDDQDRPVIEFGFIVQVPPRPFWAHAWVTNVWLTRG